MREHGAGNVLTLLAQAPLRPDFSAIPQSSPAQRLVNLIGTVLLLASLIAIPTGAVLAIVGASTRRPRRLWAGVWTLAGAMGMLIVVGALSAVIQWAFLAR